MLAAVAVVAATGMVGVAGAADEANVDIYAKDLNGGLCFSETDGGECQANERADVEIATGDTITWDFDGSGQPHNAASSNAVPADPAWEGFAAPPSTAPQPFVTSGRYSRQFTQPGTYEFLCQVHPQMVGTITVTGEPTGPPPDEEEPPAEETPDPQPTTQPGGDHGDDVTTPAPDGVQDTVSPAVDVVRTRAKRRAVRVWFTLSEPASVKVRLKRSGKRGSLRKLNVQAPAGTRSIKVRAGQRLKRSRRYVVQLRARDAVGNRSSAATSKFRGRR